MTIVNKTHGQVKQKSAAYSANRGIYIDKFSTEIDYIQDVLGTTSQKVQLLDSEITDTLPLHEQRDILESGRALPDPILPLNPLVLRTCKDTTDVERYKHAGVQSIAASDG